METMRIWLHNGQLHPMDDIKAKGLGDVVFEAIPLGEGYQGVPSDHSGPTKRAILVDLAVLDVGISTVLEEYGTIDFIPLSNKDPIILAQEPDDIVSKKALCCQKIYARYLREYEKRSNPTKILGYKLHEVTKTWFNERLRVISDHLQGLGYF